MHIYMFYFTLDWKLDNFGYSSPYQTDVMSNKNKQIHVKYLIVRIRGTMVESRIIN